MPMVAQRIQKAIEHVEKKYRPLTVNQLMMEEALAQSQFQEALLPAKQSSGLTDRVMRKDPD